MTTVLYPTSRTDLPAPVGPWGPTLRRIARDVRLIENGFEIAGTNANTMVVPGYISQFTYTFREPGEHLVVCNEYCGVGHHTMQGKVIVDPAGATTPSPAVAP